MSERRHTGTAAGADRPARFDRREFLGKAALVGGGIAVTAAVPWPGGRGLAVAAMPAAAIPANAAGPVARGPLLADWTIDDQWGAYPRYADPIGFGRRAEDGRDALAAAEPLAAVFYG